MAMVDLDFSKRKKAAQFALSTFEAGQEPISRAFLRRAVEGLTPLPSTQFPSFAKFIEHLHIIVQIDPEKLLEFLRRSMSMFLDDGEIVSMDADGSSEGNQVPSQAGEQAQAAAEVPEDEVFRSEMTSALEYRRRLLTNSSMERFRHVEGVALDLQEVLEELQACSWIKVTHEGNDIFLTCTHAFLNFESRRLYHLRNQTHYMSSNSYIAGEEPLIREVTKLLCRYRAAPTENESESAANSGVYPYKKYKGRKKENFCDALAVEHRFVDSGITLLYQQMMVGDPVNCTFSGVHRHAASENPAGLSAEFKQFIDEKVDQGKTKDEVIALLEQSVSGGKLLFGKQQIIKEVGRNRSVASSVKTGQQAHVHLAGHASKVNLEGGEPLVAESFKYYDILESCSVLTCQSWMRNLDNCEHLYLDGTHVETRNGNYIILSLLAKSNAGHIRPVAISTAYDENTATLKQFLTFVFDDLSRACGLDVRRNPDGCFVLPFLSTIVADGIRGLDATLKSLFGEFIRRGMCYFHVCQAIRRWMTANKVHQRLQSYMQGVLVYLSVAESFAEFLALWHNFREELGKRSQSVQYSEAPALIKYFEDTFVKNPDGNHWCQALSPSGERLSRSTVCESFNRSVKRILPDVIADLRHLHVILIRDVFPEIHASARAKELNISVVTPKEWNEALLLKILIARRHRDTKLALRYVYAYHYKSGKIFVLPDDEQGIRVTWQTTMQGPQVKFINASLFRLKCQGFCIISCEELPSDPSWFWKAACSCLDFVDRAYKTCIHILTLYLFLCENKIPAERLKLVEGKQEITRLEVEQTRREQDASIRGFRYVKSCSYGREFVHFMLTGKNDVLELEEKAAIDAHKQYVVLGNQPVNNTFLSPQVTKLLQMMPSDGLRRRVRRDGLPLPDLPDHPTAQASGPKPVVLGTTLRECGESKSTELSAKRKTRVTDRRTGKTELEADLKQATTVSLKRPRRNQ
jgi:hypothetical protein